MKIQVKVLNGIVKQEVKNEDKSMILTSSYVRKLNKGISYRILEREAHQAQAVRSLKRNIFR